MKRGKIQDGIIIDLTTDAREIATLKLAILFNKSLIKGKTPKAWKNATIILMYTIPTHGPPFSHLQPIQKCHHNSHLSHSRFLHICCWKSTAEANLSSRLEIQFNFFWCYATSLNIFVLWLLLPTSCPTILTLPRIFFKISRRVALNISDGGSLRVLRLMYISHVRSMVDYASPILCILPMRELNRLKLYWTRPWEIYLDTQWLRKFLSCGKN